MLICAVDSSAKAVSVAVVKDGLILGESFVDIPQTHSETLMPMLSGLLELIGISVSEIQGFAVTVGPGSFTGIRIGIACVKGLAFPFDTPCFPVSTLETIAQGGIVLEGRTIGAVMDARRNQVYHARFLVKNGVLVRQCPDEAISIEELCGNYRSLGAEPFLLGDGSLLCHRYFQEQGVKADLGTPTVRYQRAANAGILAEQNWQTTIPKLSPQDLVPVYLRPSQAERERAEREAHSASAENGSDGS